MATSVALVVGSIACSPSSPTPNGALGTMSHGSDPTPKRPAPPRPPDTIDNDAGTLIGRRARDAGGDFDAAPRSPEDDAAAGPIEAGTTETPAACPTPLGSGDLAIVELMLATAPVSGDRGEWLEVQSTRSCVLNLNGLHGEVPYANAPSHTLDVTADLLLAPNGTFLIADSLDPAANNGLPGPILLAWNGSPADVLDDTSGTVTLSANGDVVDTVTYPGLQSLYGVTISFPADCAWSLRSNWARWSLSSNVWMGAFLATPNAANTDVGCY